MHLRNVLGWQHAGNTFRVEEYKKPEFEVKVDSPSEPVKLGDKIPVTIDARYYFGAPVTHATVKYTVKDKSVTVRAEVTGWDLSTLEQVVREWFKPYQ